GEAREARRHHSTRVRVLAGSRFPALCWLRGCQSKVQAPAALCRRGEALARGIQARRELPRVRRALSRPEGERRRARGFAPADANDATLDALHRLVATPRESLRDVGAPLPTYPTSPNDRCDEDLEKYERSEGVGER